MIKKLGPDDFAKGVMVLSVFGAGVLVGAMFGGIDSFRQWTGALSGWFAGGAALWIGFTQLQPLLKDMQNKERDTIASRLSTLDAVRKTLGQMQRETIEIAALFSGESAAKNQKDYVISACTKAGNLSLSECMTTYAALIDSFYNQIEGLKCEAEKYRSFADTIPKLRTAKLFYEKACLTLMQSLVSIRSDFVEHVDQDDLQTLGTFYGFLTSEKATSSFLEVEGQWNELITAFRDIYQRLLEERHSLETSLLTENNN